MSRFGTKLAMSTAYHPQTDGQSEKDMLRHYISHNQKDWVDHLSTIEFAYNNSVHPSTGMSPFELDVGQHPITPHTTGIHDRELPTVDGFIEEQQARLTMAQDALQQAQAKQAKYYNEGRKDESFSVGDLVLVSTDHTHPPFLRTKGSKKLRPKFVGPWPITRKIGRTTYELDLPVHIKIHPVVNTQYLKRFIGSPADFAGREQTPPPPVPVSDNEVLECEVEAIKDHRKDRKGNISYLVAWKGYEDHDMTWEPASNLDNSKDLLDLYWKEKGSQSPESSTRKRARRS
jgi:hypothetical protein